MNAYASPEREPHKLKSVNFAIFSEHRKKSSWIIYINFLIFFDPFSTYIIFVVIAFAQEKNNKNNNRAIWRAIW